MKIIYKILLSCIIFYMAICQLNSYVFSYKIDEVKDLINYHEVAVDGEPEGLDDPQANNIVQYELSNMEFNVEFPVIQTTPEMIIYGKKAIPESIDTASSIIDKIEMLDINFFDLNSGNESSRWKSIQNRVYTFTRVFTYIAIALMLTLLIFMGVVIAYRSATGKIIGPSFVNTLYSKKSPKKGSKKSIAANVIEAKFIEQWVISLILLVIVFFIMSLIIYFSESLESLYEDRMIENKEITVYVHDNTRTRFGLLFYN